MRCIPTWLTSKLSRFMADLGSLIMSSSFFSRVSIRLSAPSDMTAASVGQSRVEYAKVCPNCVSLHVKPPLCSWLMAVGLAEQPWALSPPKSPPTGIVCTMRGKLFPKQRLPASRNLPSESVLGQLALWLRANKDNVTLELLLLSPPGKWKMHFPTRR